MAPYQRSTLQAYRLARCFLVLFAMWWALRDTPGTLFATSVQKKVDLAPNAPDLKELKARKSDLEKKLRSIRLPAPTSVMAFGREHPVPSTVEDPDKPSSDMIRFLSGYFAGRGSMSSDQARLRVYESGLDASNLLLFQKYFGGSISVSEPGSGLNPPTLMWDVREAQARRAARLLSNSTLPKQRRLAQMAEGRFGAEDSEVQEKVAFRHWAEVAGFLEVCMILTADVKKHLSLVVRSPDKALLEALAAFVKSQATVETRISSASNKYQLQASQRALRQILTAALKNGLFVQQEAAEAALGWTRETHWEVLQKLQESKSNQERFSRLSEEGVRRLNEVDALTRDLKKLERQASSEQQAEGEELRLLRERIATLLGEHKRLQLVEEIQRLQEHFETVQKQLATAQSEV